MESALPAPDRFLDDVTVIERVLLHLENGTTDVDGEVWSEPAENYTSTERFHLEVDRVLRPSPVAFCPSAALSEPGSFVARDASLVPVVVTRDETGQVHAFLNACQHRGATVAEGSGCAKALVCPFHGWVYGLDGTLRRLPHDETGFPNLDHGELGLSKLIAFEHGGIVYVSHREDAADRAQIEAIPPQLADDLEIIEHEQVDVAVNWKVFTEGFLEGYHFLATHRDSFMPYHYDNITVLESAGRHHRITFPFRRVEKLIGQPRERWTLDGYTSVAYHLFPNVIVAHLTHHVAFVVIEPLDVSHSRLIIYRLASTTSADGRSAEELVQADSDFVKAGAAEDQDVAYAVQRGISSGGIDALRFGRYEWLVADFHRHIDALLGNGSDSALSS